MDPDLVEAFRRLRDSEGGDGAVREFDRRLRPRLARYFRHGPWPADEATDLVQKTLVRVYAHVDQLQDPERFTGWLFAIARNVRRTAAAEWGARRAVETPAVETDTIAGRGRDAERAAIDGERARTVARAIAGLPPRQRQCVLLRARAELSYEEIAEVLRLNPLTVRNHLAQARESLRRALHETKESVR